MLTPEKRKEIASLAESDFGLILRDFFAVHVNDPYNAAEFVNAIVRDCVPVNLGDDPPRLVNVSEFYASVGEPPPALVDDFIPTQKLLLMSGSAKEGKSLVALEFLHCISEGRSLMGKFPIDKAYTCCYFGLEDGAHEIKSRLMQRGILSDNLYICWNGFDMNKPDGFEIFVKLIKELPEPPALVIIDTAREAFGSMRDWNDASNVQNAISPLRKWAQKNCTVILITHNNKNPMATGNDRISGSGALVSACDSTMVLDKKKVLENGNLRWHWEMGGRGVKQTKLVLEMDTDNLHVRVLESEELQEDKIADRVNDRQNKIDKMVECAERLERFTAVELSNAAGIAWNYAKELISALAKDGVISDTGERQAHEGAGKPAVVYVFLNQTTVTKRQSMPYKDDSEEF